MDCNLLSPQDLYVLTCTECHNAYPPSQFRGQHMEFRMCAKCKRNNPEIYHYLEKYIYQPQRDGNWRPFQDRLDAVTEQCFILEAELNRYKCELYGLPSASNCYDSKLLMNVTASQTGQVSPETQSEYDF